MARGSTRKWRQIRSQILAASDVCHICGKPGADSVDHLIPVAHGGKDVPSNLRPAHLHPCNRAKSTKEWAPIVKRSGSLD